jgi:glutathionylspermidine synthase
MKPAIQSWPMLSESWQDTVPFVLNSKGHLVVGNIKQPKLFHYVEKSFMSKKILKKLKELSNE